jgi:hypothetical protein
MKRTMREQLETKTKVPKRAEIPIQIVVCTYCNASGLNLFAFKLSWKTKSQKDKGWYPVHTMLSMNHKVPLDKTV